MTITRDVTRVFTEGPRGLVSPELFGKLANYVAKHQEVTYAYAERMVCQMLVWLQAVADNPTKRLAMDETVDPAWHAFILHSQEYTEFCDQMYGRYLHHVPPAPGSTMDNTDETVSALKATGYYVDTEFWQGIKPCCPPNPCVVAVTKCGSGTGAPPPVSA